MPKKMGETLCERRGNIIGNAGKHVWNCHLQGFLGHLVTSFPAAPYDPWMMGNIFPCEVIKNHSMNQDDRGTDCAARVSNWIYSARHTWYSQIYLSLFASKLLTSWLVGNSAYPKESKQVLIVFDWKEDTSLEEEAKVNATRFIISYLWLWREEESIFRLLFSCFDYFLFIPQEVILPGVTS